MFWKSLILNHCNHLWLYQLESFMIKLLKSLMIESLMIESLMIESLMIKSPKSLMIYHLNHLWFCHLNHLWFYLIKDGSFTKGFKFIKLGFYKRFRFTTFWFFYDRLSYNTMIPRMAVVLQKWIHHNCLLLGQGNP